MDFFSTKKHNLAGRSKKLVVCSKLFITKLVMYARKVRLNFVPAKSDQTERNIVSPKDSANALSSHKRALKKAIQNCNRSNT